MPSSAGSCATCSGRSRRVAGRRDPRRLRARWYGPRNVISYLAADAVGHHGHDATLRRLAGRLARRRERAMAQNILLRSGSCAWEVYLLRRTSSWRRSCRSALISSWASLRAWSSCRVWLDKIRRLRPHHRGGHPATTCWATSVTWLTRRRRPDKGLHDRDRGRWRRISAGCDAMKTHFAAIQKLRSRRAVFRLAQILFGALLATFFRRWKNGGQARARGLCLSGAHAARLGGAGVDTARGR